MNLFAWAQRWRIDPQAISELRQLMGVDPFPEQRSEATTEAGAQQRVRLQAAQQGWLLWRNNVGAMEDAKTSQVVRFGLANESKKMNDRTKSSDLIGIKPVVIESHMVGHTIGQFVAREVKVPGWTFTGAGREQAQLNYLKLVLSRGGDAAFTTGEL